MSADKIEIESPASAPITDPEALKEAVRKQVEYYFSKDNLQTDLYLVKLMDSNNSAPISAIMKFAKMKSLTQDEAVLRSALATSTVVTVVDDKIKSLVGGAVPAKPTVQRSTIILREIPSDTPEAEVREIFNFESCKPIHSVRSDVGDTWFVVMETEEEAKDTLLDLKLKKRTFRGQSVKCRLKSEQSSVMRSFYPGASGSSSSAPPSGSPGHPNSNPNGGSSSAGFGQFPPQAPYMLAGVHHGGMPMTMVGGGMGPGHVQAHGAPHGQGFGGNGVPGGMMHNNHGGHHAPHGAAAGAESNNAAPAAAEGAASAAHPAPSPPKGGNAAGNTNNSNKNKQQGGKQQGGANAGNNNDSSGNNSRKGNKQGNNNANDSAAASSGAASGTSGGAAAGTATTGTGKAGIKKIEMNSSNFPPLADGPAPAPTTGAASTTGPSAAAVAAAPAATTSTLSANSAPYTQPTYSGSYNPAWQVQTGDIPAATPGYKGAFVSYTYEDIITIVRNVQDATLPKNITQAQAQQHSAVMDMTPNMDLLHRQRTFSIDETREQLQQGRPVQREAVMSGTVETTVSYNNSSSGGKSNKNANKAPSSGSTFSYASVVKSVTAAPTPEEQTQSAAVKKEAPKAATGKAAAKAEGKGKGSSSSKKGGADKDAAADKATAASATDAAATTEGAAEGAATKEAGSPNKRGKRSDGKAEDNASATTSTLSANASAWGGKPSFANVLKLASDEPAAATTTSPSKPAAAAVESEDKASQGGRSSGGVKKTQYSGHRGGDKERDDHGRERQHRDRNSHNSGSNSAHGHPEKTAEKVNAMSGGMWRRGPAEK